MGATGGALSHAIDAYKKNVAGKPRKIIAVNLIVTPEYLKRVTAHAPRGDRLRAAARPRALAAGRASTPCPAQRWDRERGLNDKQYIVPGGGGFGEIMNNAYV